MMIGFKTHLLGVDPQSKRYNSFTLYFSEYMTPKGITTSETTENLSNFVNNKKSLPDTNNI